MKIKSFLTTCLLCFMALHFSANAQQTARQLQVAASLQLYASGQGFTLLKNSLTQGMASLKAAKNADEVCDAIYNYIKKSLVLNKHYTGLTDYQKKQIDSLQKQYGVLSQAKIAKFNCKKKANEAIQRATLDAMATMK